MKIRTQFTLALLLLAVVPLGVIVLYSYFSSQRALRDAVEAEAAASTREMEERMAAVRLDLAQRVYRVGELGLSELAAGRQAAAAQGERHRVMGRILEELGEAAPLVESFEFTPRPGAAPEPVVRAESPEVPRAAESGDGQRPPASGFVIEVEKIIDEMELKIAEELEGVELDEEDREALRKARDGVAAAATIVGGISRIAGLFGAGDEISLGDLEISLGEADPEAPAVSAADAVAPMPPAPPTSNDPRVVTAWLEQQQEWKSRFEQWEVRREESRPSGDEDAANQLWSEGGDYYVPVREQGEVVGAVRARISGDQLLKGVLARTRQDKGEVPFAVDGQGRLHTLNDEDRERLASLPIQPGDPGFGRGEPTEALGNWVVTTSQDPITGLSYGIARPIGDSLARMRATAARNFALGLVLLLGAVAMTRPLSRRMTGSLARLNEGVERIARGDFDARVEVHSNNEIGQLAAAFNQMAEQVRDQQEQLLGEERRRRAEEVERTLLEAEYRRKSEELEEARRFQLSLLPARLPEGDGFELAVEMETATEVGGDYYDFRLEPNGTLTAAVGDATGHGARAGTMVTVIKSLFSAYRPQGELAAFLTEAGQAVRRMDLGRMAMALTLVELRDGRLRLAAAGMPPALLHRGGGGELEELLVEGMPLGGIATDYRQIETGVAPGDTVLMLSDGLVELPDAEGEPFGYRRVREAFTRVASRAPEEIVAALKQTAREWTAGGPPNDDMTFVVLRVR